MWAKIEKLNKELVGLVEHAHSQQENLFKKGEENVEVTKSNNNKLRELQLELAEEQEKVKKARRGLDRASEEAENANLVPDMHWWHMVGHGLVLAIVIGVAVHVAVTGTAGTAEVVIGIAGVLLLGYYGWTWLADHWGELRAEVRANSGFL